jgi:hypothetical protein
MKVWSISILQVKKVLPPGFEPGYRAFTGLPREAAARGSNDWPDYTTGARTQADGTSYINVWDERPAQKVYWLTCIFTNPDGEPYEEIEL